MAELAETKAKLLSKLIILYNYFRRERRRIKSNERSDKKYFKSNVIFIEAQEDALAHLRSIF